jgi:hypothetical protein
MIELQSDIDWIFDHGPEIADGDYGPGVVDRLAKDLGIDNIWGPRGEAITMATNTMIVMQIAEKCLRERNKAEWITICEIVQRARDSQRV